LRNDTVKPRSKRPSCSRVGLTDAAWRQIAPLLPKNGRKGKQWRDHRRVIDGILWRLRTGAPWRDVPERYGPWQTCYDRFVRWRQDGTWEMLLTRLQSEADPSGKLEWTASVASTVARAHQHSAGARRAPSKQDAKGGCDIREMRPSARVAVASPRRSISPAMVRGARSR
jgi:transposase